MSQGPLGLPELRGAAVDERPEAVYCNPGVRKVAPIQLYSRYLSEPHGRVGDPVARRDSQDLIDRPLSLGLLLGGPQTRIVGALLLLRRGALLRGRRRLGRWPLRLRPRSGSADRGGG